jgi:hypothetical protein
LSVTDGSYERTGTEKDPLQLRPLYMMGARLGAGGMVSPPAEKRVPEESWQ